MKKSQKVRIVLDAATYAAQDSDTSYLDPLDILQEATWCMDALLSLPLQLAEEHGKDVFNGKLRTKDPLVRYPLGRFYSKIHPLFLLADSPEAQYPNMAFFFRQYALESGALTESELPPLPSEMLNGDCGYEYLVRTTNIDGQSDLATLIGEGTITSIRTSVIQKLHKEATTLLQAVAQGQKNTPEQMQAEGKFDACPSKSWGSSSGLVVPRATEEDLSPLLRTMEEIDKNGYKKSFRSLMSEKKSTPIEAKEEDTHSGEKASPSSISQKQADINDIHELQLNSLTRRLELLEEKVQKLMLALNRGAALNSGAALNRPSSTSMLEEKDPELRSASMQVVALVSHWASDSLGVFFDRGEYNSATPISRAKVTYTEGAGWSIDWIPENEGD